VERAKSAWSGYLLGLVPLGAALVFGAILLPRATPAEDVPVPVADGRVLARVQNDDAALARTQLPDDVRALGSALRAFNTLESQQTTDAYVTPETMNAARSAIDQALRPIVALPTSDALLLALRAAQLELFVAEVKAYEATGKESAELIAIGGPFVHRMQDVGWGRGDHGLAMDESVLRTMFKMAWNALLHIDRAPFSVSLDEQRALYAFYLRHPHAPETTRKRIDEARAAARTAKSCAALVEAEAMAAEGWRLDKVRRIGALDPAYPTAYAVGVAHYRHKDYEAAVESFRDWIDAHPNGPWTLRARNYIRAALERSAID
jgi:TolA-binding protein